jgi:hypothetical protein
MILSGLFWLVVAIILGLILIPVLLIGAVLLLGLALLAPPWIPMVIIIAGATITLIGLMTLLLLSSLL